MSNTDKMRFETRDLTAENRKKLAELFPGVVAEDKVNIDLLRAYVGEEIFKDEAYEFTWVGKRAAIAEAGRPIRKTLRPVIEDETTPTGEDSTGKPYCSSGSRSWDTTENLYIEGDNLEVLKLLQESYLGKIKMIYIDPPYNTGNDFLYRDDFSMTREEYEEQLDLLDENGNRLFKNTETNGRFHSDWCSMMYPRLVLARNLLRDDGVIFISIDDNEVHNLRKICDEVFGEDNFVNLVVVKMSELSGLKMKFVNKFPKLKEYLLVYSKNKSNLRINIPKEKKDFDKIKDYSKYYTNIIVNIDDEPDNWVIMPFNEYITRNNIVLNTEEEIVKWKIENADRMVYRTNSKTVEKYIQKNPDCKPICRIVNADGNEIIKWDNKEMLFLNKYIENYVGDLWLDISTINLNKEICDMTTFENGQKPLSLIKRIINVCPSREDCIILDFFSGSATTAHAVMQLNAEDGGKRKFIMVQLPEVCAEGTEAYKAGYPNICEIGKERIRRAGDRIKAENKDKPGIENLDIGFRVFKLDSSNMNDVYYAPADYSQGMLAMMEDNIKADRTDLDLLFGCLLEWGLSLSLPHTWEEIEGCTVHTYNGGDLIACFDENVPESVVREIANRQPLRAVFRDSSFASSPGKINVFEIFKLLAPNTTVKVI